MRSRADRYQREPPPMAEGSVLVIEVADSSLEYDRQVKAPLYARYDVLEYWIVDLTTAAIEVYREAQDGVYRPASRFGVGKPVSPLFLPEARIEVGDLMRV